MKNFLKGKFGTVIILLFTVILAGVAIFTALRLYQLRSQPVAPNVPSSIPRAAENACSLSFTLTVSETPIAYCLDIKAYKENWAPITEADAPLIKAGYKGYFCVRGEATSGSFDKSKFTINDVALAETTLIRPGSTDFCQAYTIPAGVTEFKITAQIHHATLDWSTNTCSLSFNGPDTPTPTPTATPTPTVTATPTTTPGPTATPNSCGGTCGSNTNCGTGYYCYMTLGLCRSPSCPTQADCNCPGSPTPTVTPRGTGTPRPTATPTAPTLPVSGTDWPTILGAGIGIFVILGSLLLAL